MKGGSVFLLFYCLKFDKIKDMDLNSSLEKVRGVSPGIFEKLDTANLRTVGSLLGVFIQVFCS